MKNFLVRLVGELAAAFWREYFRALSQSRQIIVEEPTDEDHARADRFRDAVRLHLRSQESPGARPPSAPQDYAAHDAENLHESGIDGRVDRVHG